MDMNGTIGDDTDQGDDTPPDDTGAPADGPMESINLCDKLTDDERKEIAARVCRDFDADIQSRSKHMQKLKRWQELYASVIRAKTWPFDRAANVNVPLLAYTVLQIQGRLFDMIIPSKGEIFHSLPTDESPEELDRADRTEKHINYLCRHEIDGFVQMYDGLLYRMAIDGSTFATYNWDPLTNCIVPENIPIEDFVVPFRAKATNPQMRGVPRYTRIHWLTYFDVMEKVDGGFFFSDEKTGAGAARITPSNTESGDADSEFRQTVDELEGSDTAGDSTDEDRDRQVLEMHIRWLKLPKEPKRHHDFDGKPHAVIAFVDDETKELLRLVIREEDDPKDAKRFAREDAAFQAYQQEQAQFEAQKGVTVDPMTGQLVPMPQPAPVRQPKPTRQREITFFTHYRAFPSAGFYGLGFGDMVGPLNEAMNTILNQSIDRGTVNNSRGGFVSRQLRFQRGPITMQPGQFTEIDAPPAALKDGLKVMDPIEEDPSMSRTLQQLEQWAQRTAGSGDTLSGEPIGANETAQAAELRTQQAQKQISVLGNRVLSYMQNDACMIWRLLSIFLPEQDNVSVQGPDGQPQTVQISRADFIADPRVFPVADPRITSKQERVQDCDATFAWAMQNPLMAQNPQIMHALTERCLHAREMADMVPLLTPPQPPPPPPVPQEVENGDFLEGKMPQVNPADNDDDHLQKIEGFKLSPEARALTPAQNEALDQHARNHIAQKIKKAAQNGQQGNVPPGAGPGNGGMAGPPHIQAPPPAPPAQPAQM